MAERSFVDRISKLSSQTLYLLLILVCTVTLFFKADVPSKPEDQSVDMFLALSQLDPSKPILIQSDWTNSSRGESMGQFEALMRIIMRRKVKFLLYAVGDAQAPQVARNVINRINLEQPEAERYKLFEDWVDAGYYADPSGAFATSMKGNIRAAFKDKQNRRPDGQSADIWGSPVLAKVKRIGDFQLLVNITASGTMDFLIARVGGSVPLALMCTGVIGPQMQQYYASGQLVGLSIGLKGVYDIERMMESGVRGTSVPKSGPDDKRIESTNFRDVQVEPFTGLTNYDRGAKYYLALHAALTLMILAVLAGNASIIASKFKGRGK
ncbi:MAG: hypothetical protein JNM85_10395 [Chthonomonas sp.]|nr:hypothetical protein [Chthonomonas sp.]